MTSESTFAIDLPLPPVSNQAHPLFTRVATMPHAAWVDLENCERTVAQAGICVLLVAGDPVRYAEGLDVAVVLPELRQHFSASYPQFFMGMVTAADEDAIAKKYGATRRPSMIFFRDGQYLDCLGGMLDWDDYLVQLPTLLAAVPKRAPSIGIAVVNGDSKDSSCH